jgi:hypothetical protein
MRHDFADRASREAATRLAIACLQAAQHADLEGGSGAEMPVLPDPAVFASRTRSDDAGPRPANLVASCCIRVTASSPESCVDF